MNDFSLKGVGGLALRLMAIVVLAGSPMAGHAQTPQDELVALRLIRTAEENLAAGARDRGVAILENMLEQYPASDHRHRASLLLARAFVETGDHQAARSHLRLLLMMDRSIEEMSPEHEAILSEALYLEGRSAFERGEVNGVFPPLRRLLREFPTSSWVNEAYFYIGMAHFRLENWQGAIDTLSLVGTAVDSGSAESGRIEAGERFYVRLKDPDLPILHRLGESIEVRIETGSGDRERIECVPIQPGAEVFIGSIPTAVGPPVPGDNRLQVRSGDTVRVFFVDRNTEGGEINRTRLLERAVVSTGRIVFSLGNWEGSTGTGFVGQFSHLDLFDADLSVSDGPDEASVTVVSRFPAESGPDDGVAQIVGAPPETDEVEWVERDRIQVALREVGEEPVRTGIFRGRLELVDADAVTDPDPGHPRLKVKVGDEVVVFYEDRLHLGGNDPRVATAAITVSGDIQSLPRATQYVVDDPIMRSEKHLIEARAFYELARIFREMGLRTSSDERADEALALLAMVLEDERHLPRSIVEQTYQKKWETELLKEDYASAIRTCSIFTRRFPDSPLAEDAYLRIAGSFMEQGERASLNRARVIYRNLLNSQSVLVQAEAAYSLAVIMRRLSPGNPGAAIPLFQNVVERFPESPHAGEALSTVIDFHIEQGNFPVAVDLLERVFSDQPDAPYLDSMLMKWVVVAIRQGELRVAAEKAEQLLLDFPGSRFAPRAQELLPRIRQRL